MVTQTFSDQISELLGNTNSEIANSCLFYCTVVYSDSVWVRRRVETTQFESEITLSRHFTFDVDFDAINSLRSTYARTDAKCFLPALKGLRRAPLLDIDISGSIAVSTARRRENATLGAAVVVGHVLRELREKYGDLKAEVWISWVRPFITWMLSLERDIDTNAVSVPNTVGELDGLLPKYLPIGVRATLLLFFEELQNYLKSYTLHLVVPCHSSEDSATTNVPCTGVAQFKVTRPDSIEHDRPSGAHRRISGRLVHFLFMGTEYMVNLPQFGSGDGGHARLVCPKGLTIDSIDIFQGDEYFQLHRQPQGSDTSKYWSLHHGYISDAKSSQDKPNDQVVALEVMYNRKRIELHDRGLPPVPPATKKHNALAAPGVWQVRMSMSSRRSRFLGPTLGLLVCSIYALIINAAPDSNLSPVSTLGLPILLGFLIAGEEHLVLSRTLAKVRWLVGLSTASFVIAACTIAAKQMPRFHAIPLKLAIFLGVAAVIMVFGHIARIQLYRTNVFEELRYSASKVYHDHVDSRYENNITKMNDYIAQLDAVQKSSASTRQDRKARKAMIRDLKSKIRELRADSKYTIRQARLEILKDRKVLLLCGKACLQMLRP